MVTFYKNEYSNKYIKNNNLHITLTLIGQIKCACCQDYSYFGQNIKTCDCYFLLRIRY